MKKLIIVLASLFVLSSCGDDRQYLFDKKQNDNSCIVRDSTSNMKAIEYGSYYAVIKVVFEGHEYLRTSGHSSLVHSESCPCKKVVK